MKQFIVKHLNKKISLPFLNKNLSSSQRYTGFTLAEVLITLGIIGTVAAFTIPTLIHDVQDQNFKVAYKKAFSVANNAFKQATADGTTYVPMQGTNDSANACVNWQIFSSQFKKAKECINSNNAACYQTGGETLNGNPQNSTYAFVDSSGMAWSMRVACTSTNYNKVFIVDTNGSKGPNKFGKDRWTFDWVLDNVSSGTPIKITAGNSQDYINGATDVNYCPTGPCYYQSWLLN